MILLWKVRMPYFIQRNTIEDVNHVPEDESIEIRIGQRIREMRKAAGLTQQQLAESSGLSKATLSKIELGQISSPISTFSRIAKCLNLTFEDFIRTSEPMSYLIIRKDDPRPLASQKAPYGYRFELLGERWPNKNIVPYMITYDPDPRNKTRPNFKHEMDEFIYVLEGNLDYYYENEIFFLEPGDAIFIDGSRTHGGRAHGDTPCRALLFAISKK